MVAMTTTVTAQEKEDILNPVTVTASLKQSKAANTGRNIISIKGEAISKLPVNSVDELLRYLPGIEVQQRGPMGSQSDFVIRGGTFQQVLVIIDGIRLNDPNTGHFSGNIPIAPSEIDRIEVLKGASSALYGSEAVGGVIHIITKSFAAGSEKKKQFGGSVSTGEYGLFTANAGGVYSNGKTAIGAGVLSNHSTGQLQRGTRGFFHNNTVSVSVNHHINKKWQLSARSSYDIRDFGAQNFYTTFLSDTAEEKLTTSWNQLRLGYKGEKDRFSVQAGYKTVKDEYLYNLQSVANESRSKLWQALAIHEHDFSGKTSLSGGLQFQNREISSNDRGEHAVKQVGAFAVLNQKIGESFYVHPAIRFDWDEKRGWEFVPQLNAAYRVNQFVFRASAGKTIRDADFTERYNNYNKDLVTSGRIGNPNLGAERSYSYEVGADYFMKSNLKLSVGGFIRDHSDLIDWANTVYADMPRQENLAPGGTYALAKNIASVKTYGVETDLQYTRSISSNQSFYATAGWVWLYTKSSNSVPSFYISSHAKMLTNFNVMYSVSHFSVSVNGIYKSRVEQAPGVLPVGITKDYFVLNARAEYAILKRKLGLFAQVSNITDKQYSDLLGSVMPGRWLSGGLRFAFSK